MASRDADIGHIGAGRMNWEILGLTYTHYRVLKQIASGTCYIAQEVNLMTNNLSGLFKRLSKLLCKQVSFIWGVPG